MNSPIIEVKMFTGIVEEFGHVEEIIPADSGVKLKIQSKKLALELETKSSISINGCCLTCVDLYEDGFSVDVVAETLRKTCLSDLKAGDKVNLELPLKLGARLDGHLVQGHIDQIGFITSKTVLPDHSLEVTFQANLDLMRYIVEKGSIAVDGVSLTAWNVKDFFFSVALIPYTAKNTTLGIKGVGERVNLEIDLIAKYIEKLASAKQIKALDCKCGDDL